MGVKQRIQYRYDARGNRSGLTAPDGGRFTYSYDVVNRLQTVVNPQAQRTTFQYDLAGRRTGTLLANGNRTSTLYDDASRITAVYNRKADGTPQTTFEYGYDNSGNRTSVVDVDGRRTTWSYDAANQLTGEHRGGIGGYRHTFTYDSRGNRTLKDEDGQRTTYAYDAANQLRHSDATGGRTTYVYDADGNQQVTLEPSGDRTTNVWDYENRLSSAQLPTGLRNTMAYDPEGLRVQLQESGGTKKFVWDDQNYLAQADGSDVIQTVYTSEPQTYGNLISHRQGGQTTWYQFDALGSTRALTDATQTILAQYNYGAWGTLLGSPTLLTPFLWVGRAGYHWDAEIQNQYVRARYYRPVVARWVTIDPLSLLIGRLQLFSYSANQPASMIDPSGLLCFDNGPLKYMECGNVQWTQRFRLSTAEQSQRGFIIQRIEKLTQVYSCPGEPFQFHGTAKCGTNFTSDPQERALLVYWEIVPLDRTQRASQIDFWGTRAPFSPSIGRWYQLGVSWFHPGDEPPDGWSKWTVPANSPAGSAYMRCDPPTGDPITILAKVYREASIGWNCCREKPCEEQVKAPRDKPFDPVNRTTEDGQAVITLPVSVFGKTRGECNS